MKTTSTVRSRCCAVLRSCLAILVLAAIAISVDAATITVNSFNQIDPGQCTIATAIASINAAADQSGCTHSGSYGSSDTIVLAAGTYASTVANNGTNAYPVIQKALTINGNGATLSRTVGAVAPFFRFFEVQGGGLTLNNATLTGGNASSGTGGAIFNNIGPLAVSGSTFSGNTAIGGFGGAIYHNSTEAASISSSTFTNNAVGPSATGAAGGAVYDNSTNGMTLTNVVFTGNIARLAGAVYDNSTTGLTVTGGTFTGNSASFAAGALYDNSTGGLIFNGGTVTNNTSPGGLGGAIYDNSTGGIRISNVSFSGNSATTGTGGAIYDNSTVATGPVSNNCFVGNIAAIGGGIFRFAAPALNAINNWWGSATGPSGAGSGTGDSVSTNVTFAPFLASPPSICGGGGSPPPASPRIYWGDDGNLTIHRVRPTQRSSSLDHYRLVVRKVSLWTSRATRCTLPMQTRFNARISTVRAFRIS